MNKYEIPDTREGWVESLETIVRKLLSWSRHQLI